MTAQGDVVLQLVQVTKKYKNIVAVDDISIDVRRGEILTLLGPSGCGKTTTLRLSVGLERCTLGTVTYRGRVVDSPAQRIYEPPNRRDMGMVFQSYAIWPHMTVAENIAYPLKVRGIARAEIAGEVSRVLALVGLDGFADRPATQLSGGQQQRVALARALVSKPDILLLDEPFSNLDAKLREQMRTEVKILQRRLGITVLFVTHDQTEALSLSDRIAVMQSGKVEQLGPPQELYADPRTPAVRDFLGRTLSFTGKLVEQAGGEQRVALSSGLQLTVRGCSRGVKLSVGDACLVTLRPEFVVAQPAEGSGPTGENTITARLFALLFMGNHYEASLETPNGENILVTLPASGAWQERQALVLFLPADRLQLWPARSS